MPERPIRKGFDILEEAEQIRQKQVVRQPFKEFYFTQSQLFSALRLQLRPNASDIWRELLEKSRRFPKPEFQDDISELRQEVDTLKLVVKSLSKNLEISNEKISELSKQVKKENFVRRANLASLNKLCRAYVEMVSKIEITQKVFTVDKDGGLLCWTIIDAEPFDSKQSEPIYDAQVKIYKEMKEDFALDFHVLNLSELQDRQEWNSILPPSAKLVWQR